MSAAECPNCDLLINLGSKPFMGKLFVCPTCRTESEIVWLDPPELDIPWDYSVEEEEYDYDDDPYQDY